MSITKIKPLDNLTQVDKIEISLQEYFRSENFAPGDSIPKEMELAEAMGVSRTAIREAISRFKTLGIIESKKNRGMIMTRPDVLNNMERVLDIQLLDEDTMKDIFEMRLVIEMGITDLLFLRKTEENLTKLERIVAKEEKTDDRIKRTQYDIEFHSMLYDMSGNNMIHRFQAMLLPVFNYVNKGLSPKIQRPTKDLVTHRELVAELRNGTPDEFRNKMHNHLWYYFQKV